MSIKKDNNHERNIVRRLHKLGVDPEILYRYYEPHRFYHNILHIDTMLLKAEEQKILSDELFLAIIFHDIIYNPKETDNEELSAELLYQYVKNEDIKQAILETKYHNPTSQLSKDLCRLDLDILDGDLQTFIDFENKIFKEYQWVDYRKYKEKRIEILKNLDVNPEFINFVKNRKPKIAVYTGSFNPFHKGHYNILQKAENIFDKVIIARGVNPEKNNQTLFGLPTAIQFRQIENYDGLTTEFIESLEYDVTLIRGLRNTTDLQYELTQYRFLQDLNPKIKVISIFCDKEYEHVSSSAIRKLKLFNKESEYLV